MVAATPRTSAERRAKWYGSKWIRPEKRLAIYLRDGFKCAYCGKSLHNAKPKQVTLDHVTPVEQGGGNEHTNLVTCCKNCNDRKSAKTLEAFLRGNAGMIALIYVRLALPINVALAKSILRGE